MHFLKLKGATGLDVAYHLEALGYVGRIVAGHEIRPRDVVGGADGRVTKAQVTDRDATGLLGVVLEVRLHVLVGVVADDLDGVLVRTHGAIATKAPELALDGAGGGGVGSVLVAREREVRDVVHDADGELALGIILLELGVDCEGISGRGVLGTEAVAAADNLDVRASGLEEGAHDILVQRLADGAGLLGAVEDGDLLDRLGK